VSATYGGICNAYLVTVTFCNASQSNLHYCIFMLHCMARRNTSHARLMHSALAAKPPGCAIYSGSYWVTEPQRVHHANGTNSFASMHQVFVHLSVTTTCRFQTAPRNNLSVFSDLLHGSPHGFIKVKIRQEQVALICFLVVLLLQHQHQEKSDSQGWLPEIIQYVICKKLEYHSSSKCLNSLISGLMCFLFELREVSTFHKQVDCVCPHFKRAVFDRNERQALLNLYYNLVLRNGTYDLNFFH